MTTRDLQAAVAAATAEHLRARRSLDAAGYAYEHRRRYAPTGVQTGRARTVWGLALAHWAATLAAQETARDQLRAQHRTTAQDAPPPGTEVPLDYAPEDDIPAESPLP